MSTTVTQPRPTSGAGSKQQLQKKRCVGTNDNDGTVISQGSDVAASAAATNNTNDDGKSTTDANNSFEDLFAALNAGSEDGVANKSDTPTKEIVEDSLDLAAMTEEEDAANFSTLVLDPKDMTTNPIFVSLSPPSRDGTINVIATVVKHRDLPSLLQTDAQKCFHIGNSGKKITLHCLKTSKGTRLPSVYVYKQDVSADEMVTFQGQTITIPKGSVLKCTDENVFPLDHIYSGNLSERNSKEFSEQRAVSAFVESGGKRSHDRLLAVVPKNKLVSAILKISGSGGGERVLRNYCNVDVDGVDMQCHITIHAGANIKEEWLGSFHDGEDCGVTALGETILARPHYAVPHEYSPACRKFTLQKLWKASLDYRIPIIHEYFALPDEVTEKIKKNMGSMERTL